MYGYLIVGSKFLITAQDKRALDCFFYNKRFTEDKPAYLELAERWKSTSEICKELDESAKRTKKRLEKLLALDFVDIVSIKANKRIDHYWCISRTGMYYKLSMLTRPQIVRFLEGNKLKMREFDFIRELMKKNKPQVSHLLSNLKHFVENRQYHQIVPFVHDLLKRVFRNPAYYLPSYQPDFKDTLREKYERKTIRELEKTFGRILDPREQNSP